MNIAVIPARGGSKRIPRKNIRPFCGSPMIVYAIEAASASGLFAHIIVSTDDAEIADVAKKYGAEVPFMRPSNLADDYAETVPVVAHAIAACDALDWEADTVCCIYPAVPLIQNVDLSGALNLLRASGANYSFPVAEFPSPIQRALRRGEGGRMSPFSPEFELTRTQDLEPAYHDAGQFYWGKRSAWLNNQQIHSSGAGYLVPHWRVIDIDTEDDWARAELIFRLTKEQRKDG